MRIRTFPARFIAGLVRCFSISALLFVGMLLAVLPNASAADTAIHFSGNGDQLQAAINSAHRGATIELDSNVSLNSPLLIQDDLILKGNVNGGRATITTDFFIRLVTVRLNSLGRAPHVEFDNIVFLHGYAHGGNGGIGFSGGGGGAGMGGALFVWEAFVVVDNCVFQSNQAIGGNGGYAQKDFSTDAGGGGGVEGNDGGLSPGADAAAGNIGWGGGGGTLGGSVHIPGQGGGGNGSGGNGGHGRNDTNGDGTVTHVGQFLASNGDFGGGGGGPDGFEGAVVHLSEGRAWFPLVMDGKAGNGGYGGGGGGGGNSGEKGLGGVGGGDGGASNVVYKELVVPIGGALDQNEIAGGGGGGAGMGGAIFVRYGLLQIFNSVFQGNSTQGGSGAAFVLPSGDPSCAITSASDFFNLLGDSYCWSVTEPSSNDIPGFTPPPLDPGVSTNTGKNGGALGQSVYAIPEPTNGLPSAAVIIDSATWDPNDAPGTSAVGPVGSGLSTDLHVTVSGSTSAQINQIFPATVTVQGPPGVIFYAESAQDPQVAGPSLSLGSVRFTIGDSGIVTLPAITALNAAGQVFLRIWSVSPLGWSGPPPPQFNLPPGQGISISYMDPNPKLVLFTVLPVPFSLSMTSGPNPAVSGAPVNLTAIVDPTAHAQAADERLMFFVDGEEIGIKEIEIGTTLKAPLTAGPHLLQVQGNGSISVLPNASSTIQQLVTARPMANGMTSRTIFFTPTGVDMTSTDFNGDGYPDLVLTTQSGVFVLTNQSDGSFATTAVSPTCSNPTTAIARAIFDPFVNFADVAIGCPNNLDGVYVATRLNNGSISPSMNYRLPSGVLSMVPVDVNRDGFVDLAVGLTNGVAILPSAGIAFEPDAYFKLPSTIYSNAGSALATGNFHNTANMDLLVASNPGGLVMLPATGNTTDSFSMFGGQVQLLGPGENPRAIAVRDFNGDGNLDIAAVSEFGVYLLLGNGDGTFTTATNRLTAAGTSGFLSLTAADMDGDGNIDLVASAISGTGVYLFRGKGDGTFQPPTLLAGNVLAQKLIAGDFNRDGRTDLAALTPNGAILLTEIAPVSFSFTAPAGVNYLVDGVQLTGPATFTWDPSSQHTVDGSAPTPVSPGVRQTFLNWSDGQAATHTITAPPTGGGSLNLSYKTQYALSTAVSPANSGTIGPGPAWFDVGAQVSLSAAAAQGYKFANFSGTVSGSASPQSITMNGPTNVVANFTPLAPSLTLQVGVRTDGPGGVRVVPVTLSNTGQGVASNTQITGVTATVLTGSGAVSVATPLPATVGTVNPGGQQTLALNFIWPATAARVTLKFSFTAGSYSGTATSTVFR